MLVANIYPPVWKVMRRSGVVEKLGKERCFLIDERYPNLALRQAMVYAQEAVGDDEKEDAS